MLKKNILWINLEIFSRKAKQKNDVDGIFGKNVAFSLRKIKEKSQKVYKTQYSTVSVRSTDKHVIDFNFLAEWINALQ